MRAHLAQGYRVYPVNPRGGEIEGLAVYERLADVPVERLTRISLYLPPQVGLTMIDEIAAKGCQELWLNPGSESDELVENGARQRAESNRLRAASLASAHPLGRSDD